MDKTNKTQRSSHHSSRNICKNKNSRVSSIGKYVQTPSKQLGYSLQKNNSIQKNAVIYEEFGAASNKILEKILEEIKNLYQNTQEEFIQKTFIKRSFQTSKSQD